MRLALWLGLSLAFLDRTAAYEWQGSSPDLDGVAISSDLDGHATVVFGAAGKIYSDVLAQAGCDFGRLAQTAGGSGDSDHHYTWTSVIAHDQAGAEVRFEIGLCLRKNDGTYRLMRLVRRMPPGP